MCQSQSGQFEVVLGLGYRQTALCKRGFLGCNLGGSGTARLFEDQETLYLHGVDAHLVTGYLNYTLVIDDLNESLCHLHTYIVTDALQIFFGRFKVELGKFHVTVKTLPCKEGDIGPNIK